MSQNPLHSAFVHVAACGVLLATAWALPGAAWAQEVKKGVVTRVDTTSAARAAAAKRNAVANYNPAVSAVRPDLTRSIAEIDTNLIKRLEVARTALGRRDYANAVDVLQAGLREAESVEDGNLEATYSFHLGVAYQKQATDGVAPDVNLSLAAGMYEKQLMLEPSGPALNNLAKVYEKMGDTETAVRNYKEAISLDTVRQGLYAVNLAELYKSEGDFQTARDYYQLAIEANPDDPKANRGLTSTYLATDVNQLVNHLWRMVDRGRELRAIDNALSALMESGVGRSRESRPIEIESTEKAMLLAVVAGGLARCRTDLLGGDSSSAEYEETRTETLAALRRLASDPDIGAGATEIVKLAFRRSELVPGEFEWWAERGRQREPEAGVWPRDAFRSLIRSYGQWYYRAGDLESAHDYYMLSVRLTEDDDLSPDLESLVRLADIYVELGQSDRINDMIERYTEELFHGKGEAYRDSDFKKIYEFHRTLGLLYAYIGNWGNSYRVTSAFFQLENALEKREIFNDRMAERLGEDRLPIDVRVVEALATGYDIEDRDRGAELRLKYVGKLIDDGSPRAASNLLEQIDPSAISTGLRAEYEELAARMASLRR